MTGTAPFSYLLANILQEIWQWPDNILQPNFTSEEIAMAFALQALFGFQCYITMQIVGKLYFGAILKIFFLLDFFIKTYTVNIR